MLAVITLIFYPLISLLDTLTYLLLERRMVMSLGRNVMDGVVTLILEPPIISDKNLEATDGTKCSKAESLNDL